MENKGNSGRILELLKSQGALSAKSLSRELGISSVGTRQHLLRLEERGLVSPELPAIAGRGVGRPRQNWALTDQAWELFPQQHAQLSVDLVQGVRKLFGDEGLEQLLQQLQQQTLRRYRERLVALGSLEQKVLTLAELRSEDGYMAQAHFDSGEKTWILVENHCPINTAARSCQGICRSEQALFQELLEADVEPVQYLLSGDRRCSWQILPRQNHNQLPLL